MQKGFNIDLSLISTLGPFHIGGIKKIISSCSLKWYASESNMCTFPLIIYFAVLHNCARDQKLASFSIDINEEVAIILIS